MTRKDTFKDEQRGVASAMAGALVTTIAVMSFAVAASPNDAMPFLDRLQLGIRADLLVVAWLMAAIANVARLRFFSERDIAGSSAESGSDKVRVAGAILQNTFEQTVLAVITHLIVVATFTRSIAPIIGLACLFAVGRALFWAGYAKGATGRAFGFALTFYPSVLALLACATASLLDLRI